MEIVYDVKIKNGKRIARKHINYEKVFNENNAVLAFVIVTTIINHTLRMAERS